MTYEQRLQELRTEILTRLAKRSQNQPADFVAFDHHARRPPNPAMQRNMSPEGRAALDRVLGYKPQHAGIHENFLIYHADNPGVFVEFQQIVAELRQLGVQQDSADHVCHVIRWKRRTAKQGEFKVNNNFAKYYGELHMLCCPADQDFFETRQARKPSHARRG